MKTWSPVQSWELLGARPFGAFPIASIGSKMCWYTSSKATQVLQILDGDELQNKPLPRLNADSNSKFHFFLTCMLTTCKQHWCGGGGLSFIICVEFLFFINLLVNVEIYWKKPPSVSTLLLLIVECVPVHYACAASTVNAFFLSFLRSHVERRCASNAELEHKREPP